jgi:polyadenylation factor subunit 2
MVPPIARPRNAVDSIPVKHLHTSLNKAKYPVNVVCWTPEGRRLLTASSNGEFTLWNGMSFNFELIMQAHETAIRAASYSHSGEWLISADQTGLVKYWQPNFNQLKEVQAHSETIRGLVFSPTDAKFATASDDASLKIWDFAEGEEETTMTGHQWEIRCVDWHPTKGLLVSGSKDHSVKLWEPRSGRCLTTLSSSKNQVSRTIFEKSDGVLLATSGRDQIIRIFDLRMMREVFLLRGHDSEVTALAWHPQHRNLISSGGHGGAIHHYLLDEQNQPPDVPVTLSPYDTADPSNASAQTIYPAHSLLHAHEPTGPIWSMSYHPLGHILASGSNDRATRFWTRPRPGDATYLNDRFHIGQQAAEAKGTYNGVESRRQAQEAEEQEEQDEAEGLEEQSIPTTAAPSFLNLPGIALPGMGGLLPPALALPGFAPGALQFPIPPMQGNGAPPLPPPPMDPAKLKELLGGADLEKLKSMFGGALPPPPSGLPFPIPGLPLPLPIPGMQGLPMLPFPILGNGAVPLPAETNGTRSRKPLPSQEEMRRQNQR